MKIGVIGAGQLGRMLALAGYPLGSSFHFLDPNKDAPGSQIGEMVSGAFDDPDALKQLAQRVELITYDVENVPAKLLHEIARRTPFFPPVAALATGQDRVDEKQLFNRLGIPTPAWATVDSLEELTAAVARLGLPAVLKTRRLGYDGRGQVVLRSSDDLADAYAQLGASALILEQFQQFDLEVSVIGARNTSAQTKVYPLTRNIHVDGILRYSVAPHIDPELQHQAEQYLQQLFEHFDYAGVLTIEFFVVAGELVANEIAPRVHNSGHWTIEGAATSQFENHIRAIRGLPLGETAALGHSGMINFLGQMPPLASVLGISGAHYHDYDKSPRPMRKLGHCTVTAATPPARDEAMQAVMQLID